MEEKYTLKIYSPNLHLENILRLHPDSVLNSKTLWIGTPDEIKNAVINCKPEENIFFACSGKDAELEHRSESEGYTVRFFDEDIFSLYEKLVTRRLNFIRWAYTLKDATVLNYSIKDIVETCAAKIINGLAFVLDRNFRVSYTGGYENLENDLVKELLNTGILANPSLRRTISRISKGSILVREMENGDYCWATKVDTENSDPFYVFLFTHNDDLKNEIPSVFGLLMENFKSVYLHKIHKDIPFGDFKTLITRIVSGELTGWDEIDAYMKRLPQPPLRYISIGVIEVNPSKRSASIESLVSKLKTIFPGCCAAQVGDYVVLMISSDTRVNQPRPVFNESALNDLLAEYDGHIAFSNATQRLEKIRIAYLFAQITLKIGNSIREFGQSRIYYFEDYSGYVFLDLLTERFKDLLMHDNIFFMANPYAVDVFRYDQIHGTNLVLVLYNYCKYNGSISAAATNSYMHRNTFSSKLAQVREIMKDTDLSDRRTRERMLFSCWIFRYYTYYYNKHSDTRMPVFQDQMTETKGSILF